MNRFLLLVVLQMVVAWHSSNAATVKISEATTPSAELPGAISEAIKMLSRDGGSDHHLKIEGKFAASETIQVNWWGDGKLTVSGGGILDGSGVAQDSATLFMAGRNLSIEGIQFTNSKGHTVIVGGNSDHYAIRNCVFTNCRASAIHVWNDPHTVVAGKYTRGVISGNRIDKFNLANAKWANDGISVFDQGVVIKQNVISDSPTETNGIRAMGRDLLVERNVVKNVGVDDSGGIYLWGGPHASLFLGNVVRGNHVIGASRGIYLDDGTSGAKVIENLIERSSVCAIFISGGRDNVVERNVVDHAPVFLHIDSRCLGWDSRPEFAGLVKESLSRLQTALKDPADSERLLKHYPDLTVPEHFGTPEANRVTGNFVRNIGEEWELMDFSSTVKTDFRAINDLQSPESFPVGEDLQSIRFSERFGFLSWDRIGDVSNQKD